jgi:hypothetical protein
MAAFWEHARESSELRELAKSFRKVASWKSKAEGQQVLSHYDEIVRVDELLLLISPLFPQFPFKKLKSDGWLPRRLLELRQFGIRGLLCSPLADFFSLIATKAHRHWIEPTETFYGVAIPWSYTDAELAKEFRAMLKYLRPSNRPEPKRAGRAGRSSHVSPVDMLHRLAAFRLERLGFTFSDKTIEHRPPYYSQEGWNKAVKEAKLRIENMAKLPFFRRAQPSKREEINS